MVNPDGKNLPVFGRPPIDGTDAELDAWAGEFLEQAIGPVADPELKARTLSNRVLHLAWESDYDGILHMFADPREPDRFSWIVTAVGPPFGNHEPGVWVRNLAEVERLNGGGTFYGRRFYLGRYSENFPGDTRPSRQDPPEACWMVDPPMGGYVEIIVPGIEGTFVARVGAESVELGELPPVPEPEDA